MHDSSDGAGEINIDIAQLGLDIQMIASKNPSFVYVLESFTLTGN